MLDVSQDLEVLVLDEVDSHTLPSKTTASTDAVNVELAIGGKVVVDDQGDLLDIQAAAPKVSGDEDPWISLSELAHDAIPLFLVHIAVHAGDSEIVFDHFLSQPFHLCLSVAENDGLGDGQAVIEVT